MTNKKVLILGVGNAQKDAILYCKERGREVLGCSYTNTERWIPLLDKFEQDNIVDVEAVKDFAVRENVDLVYSIGSDIAMPTACAVSEELGLPHFVSAQTAQICNRKHRTREVLGKDFKGNNKYIVITSKEELDSWNDYPAILKPVDSQGQRGIFRVNSLEEASECFDGAMNFSREKKVILERFLDGEEVSINVYLVEGEFKFALMSDRISYKQFPGGIIKEHHIPTKHDDQVTARSIDLMKRTCDALDIKNGPCYAQIKIVDGEPYLLEITPRLDGCHMWRLIKYYCGVDLLDITFTHLLTGKVSEDSFKMKGEIPVIKTIFMAQEPGTKVQVREYPEAKFVSWYYEDGETVPRMNGYMEKCGYRIV